MTFVHFSMKIEIFIKKLYALKDRILFPIIANRIHAVFGKKEILDFQLTFITDAVVMAFQRWIVDYDEMTPEDFIHQIKLSIKYITIQYGDMDETL